jgi:hypothetical protein
MATKVLIDGEEYLAIPSDNNCLKGPVVCVFHDGTCKQPDAVSKLPGMCTNRVFIKEADFTPHLQLKVIAWRLKS